MNRFALAALTSLTLAALPVATTRADFISVTAQIPLAGVIDSRSSNLPNSSLSATAGFNGGLASARATTGFELGLSAFSPQLGGAVAVNASAGVNSSFAVLGNPQGVSIPLIFHFTLDGSMQIVPTASIWGAGASMAYSISDGTKTESGSVNFQGAFTTGTQVLTIGQVSSGVTNPSPDLVIIDADIFMSVTVKNTGLLVVTFNTTVTGGNAIVTSSWDKTFQLQSITVPVDFTALNPADIQVVFASGRVMSVGRDAPGGTTVPVPEPAALTIFALGTLGWALQRWRRNRRTLPA